jgi:hypothetical protein
MVGNLDHSRAQEGKICSSVKFKTYRRGVDEEAIPQHKDNGYLGTNMGIYFKLPSASQASRF